MNIVTDSNPPKAVRNYFGTPMPEEVRDYFKQQGAKGGKLGGKKRMESLTAEERSALAKKAVTAREKKRKAVKKKSKSS